MPMPIPLIALGLTALWALATKRSTGGPPPAALELFKKIIGDPAVRQNKLALAQYATTMQNMGAPELAAQLTTLADTLDREEKARAYYTEAMASGAKDNAPALEAYAARIDSLNIRPDLSAQLRARAREVS